MKRKKFSTKRKYEDLKSFEVAPLRIKYPGVTGTPFKINLSGMFTNPYLK